TCCWRSPCPRNCVQQTLARRLRRQTPRSLHIAEDCDERCTLVHKRDNDLGFNSAILEGVDDGLLQFHLRAAARTNSPRVGDRDVTVDVYSLSRNGDEIAGTNA